jgi:universal stress protein A
MTRARHIALANGVRYATTGNVRSGPPSIAIPTAPGYARPTRWFDLLGRSAGGTMAALFRNILVPHDFSEPATAALRVAAELAGAGGRLNVVHAMAPVYPLTTFTDGSGLPPWAPPKELIDEARQRLETLVARALKGRRVRSVRCRVLVGEPYLCIITAAREADTIVMATLGRTGLSHLLIGSVAEKVVRHATVPVLTIHARAPGRARRASASRQRGGRAASADRRRPRA